MRILKFILTGVIYICFVIPGIPCYLGVIYLVKKLYDYYNLSDNNLSKINKWKSNQHTDKTYYTRIFN